MRVGGSETNEATDDGPHLRIAPASSEGPSTDGAVDPLPDLVRQAQRGDRAAFDEIVRNSGRLVFASVRLDCPDRHAAEDVAQETFLRAWRSIRSLRDTAQVRSWLLTIARRVLIDQARRKRWTTNLDDAPVPPGVTADPTDALGGADDRRRATDALRGLPKEYRLPLTMRYLAGADHETIRRQLGLTDGALRGLLHRGLTLLREQLKND